MSDYTAIKERAKMNERNKVIFVRFTEKEKKDILEGARREFFATVSGFVRYIVLGYLKRKRGAK